MTQKLQVTPSRRVLSMLAFDSCRAPPTFGLRLCVLHLTLFGTCHEDQDLQLSGVSAADHTAVRECVQAGVRVLESVELDFSRYGDTLFEVLFAGGRLAGGGNVVEEGKKLDTNVCPTRPSTASQSCDVRNVCAYGLHAAARKRHTTISCAA